MINLRIEFVARPAVPRFFADAEAEDDAAEPAVKWFHKQADCSFRHWHGLRVPAELCHVCRPGADCGGAFSVTVKARKGAPPRLQIGVG